MNIRDMLTYHKNIGADLTVAAIRMKSSECAGKFGVIEVDENNKMIGFEENLHILKSYQITQAIH